MEQGNGREDREPQEKNLDEREVWAAQAKKDRGPEAIEYKLKGVDREGQGSPFEARLAPDKPAGNGDRDVKQKPNRAKQPGRRAPGRLSEIPIPIAWPQYQTWCRSDGAGDEEYWQG